MISAHQYFMNYAKRVMEIEDWNIFSEAYDNWGEMALNYMEKNKEHWEKDRVLHLEEVGKTLEYLDGFIVDTKQDWLSGGKDYEVDSLVAYLVYLSCIIIHNRVLFGHEYPAANKMEKFVVKVFKLLLT